MIARHEMTMDKHDIWTKLAAPLPTGSIMWRQDGKPSLRDGRWFARFVAYVEANTVRERLDGVVPGEWDLTLELLPPLAGADEEVAAASFKARLQILGVIREDVGTGRDYKAAATDAFKRAAVRFGIANELYEYEQNWVQVDGDSRFAKPLEDPQAAYTRRYAGKPGVVGVHNPIGASPAPVAVPSSVSTPASAQGPVLEQGAPVLTVSSADSPVGADNPPCPKCGGRMWDNRVGKRNPKAPDFKCRDRSCDGVIWPPKAGGRGSAAPKAEEPAELDVAPLGLTGTDDIPF
jgi:Rad52/22 family double-strand break repair protein